MALMNEIMKTRYRMYCRKDGVYYYFDRETGQRKTLGTADEKTAERLLHAKNEAQHGPLINRQIARAYLSVSEPEIFKRTWQGVMDEIIKLKTGETRHRWETAIKDKALDVIRHRPVLDHGETQPVAEPGDRFVVIGRQKGDGGDARSHAVYSPGARGRPL